MVKYFRKKIRIRDILKAFSDTKHSSTIEAYNRSVPKPVKQHLPVLNDCTT